MKHCVKLLTVIAATTIPSILMAQKTSPGFVPFSQGTKIFKENVVQDLKLLPQPSVVPSPKSAFPQHLPSTVPGENRRSFIDHSQTDPAYYYNMPIVKPGKTSKILVAEFDPNSPYSYQMPIKKNGVIEK
ncbi:hypothetical protein [Daejeonella sp.]|uniref:hypothetical protein n=1 Tax=Daejeonella sp. TaxID=2805397 RepID=UPI0030BE2F18